MNVSVLVRPGGGSRKGDCEWDCARAFSGCTLVRINRAEVVMQERVSARGEVGVEMEGERGGRQRRAI